MREGGSVRRMTARPRPCPDDRAPLSSRQAECLELAAEGLPSRDIGLRLGVSSRTVDDHLRAACHRLGVRTRVQAVAWLAAVKPANGARPPTAYSRSQCDGSKPSS